MYNLFFFRGQNLLDSAIHRGRLPAHRAGDRAARPAARARQAAVAQAPRSAALRHRHHGLHDVLLRLEDGGAVCASSCEWKRLLDCDKRGLFS